jgi:hypothetical protein
MDPKKLFYEAQKVRIRLVTADRGLRAPRGRPAGPEAAGELPSRGLEATVRRAGRRLAVGLIAGAALLGTAITASSTHVANWVPFALGAVGAVFVAGLAVDLLRRNR